MQIILTEREYNDLNQRADINSKVLPLKFREEMRDATVRFRKNLYEILGSLSLTSEHRKSIADAIESYNKEGAFEMLFPPTEPPVKP